MTQIFPDAVQVRKGRKVQHLTVNKPAECPLIKLNGQWLREWGFESGQNIKVTLQWDGSIRIEREDEEIEAHTIP